MKTRWVGVLLGGLAGASLLAAACAPAAEPKPAQPQAPAVEQPKPAAEKPAAEKPAAEKPAAEKPAAQPKTSVGGYPLDPEAKFGGVLQIAYTEEGPTFSNWEEAAGVASTAVQPVVNSLVRQQTWGTLEDFKNQAYWVFWPDLGASWEQSADGLQWTFKLRDGVAFADGDKRVPFTCKDAKWTFDAIRTGTGLRRSPRAVHFLAVKEIQCPDDLTLVFKLSRPKPGFLEVVGLPYNVIKPAYKYQGNEDEMRTKPNIGTGPYLLKEWIAGEKYVFVRKPDYWNQPFPYLDGIEARLVSSQAQFTSLRAGRLDFGGGTFSGSQAETLNKECTACQFWPSFNFNGFAPIQINHQRPPWNTPEVKDAISYAVGRVKVRDVGAEGWFDTPRGGLFRSNSAWALPYERARQIPGYNMEDPEGNKVKARELLAKAGFKSGELKLTMITWNIVSIMAYAIPIAEDLKSVGIDVTILPLITARAYDAMTAGDFDVSLHGFYVAGDDPDFILYEHFYTGSDRNYGRYANAEADRLIEQMSTTLDPELRKQRAWNIQEILLRDHAKTILGFYHNQPIWAKRVRGIMPGDVAHWSYGPVRRHEMTWLAEK